jgi:sulfate permease, SulP family
MIPLAVLIDLALEAIDLPDKAKGMMEVNVLEDPLHHPADNSLG